MVRSSLAVVLLAAVVLGGLVLPTDHGSAIAAGPRAYANLYDLSLRQWLVDFGKRRPARVSLQAPKPSTESVVHLSVSADFPASDFSIDIDLNHDGRFTGAGELGYTTGRFDGNVGIARLHGLPPGRYAARARVWDVVSAIETIEVLPPSGHHAPVSFEANKGQTDSAVLFVGRARHQTAYVKADETILVSRQSSSEVGVVRFRLDGANPAARPIGAKQLPGVSNYFIGNDPSRWHTDVDTYQELVTRDVYPNIDLVYHSAQGRLEYDFRVAPNGDPSVITLDFPDARDLTIDDDGGLTLHTTDGATVRKGAPVLYQRNGARLEAVKGSWILKGRTRAGYRVADYDRTRELVIDPIIFSTYLGGTLDDTAQAAVVDGAGNTYVTGFTLSANFPVRGPAQATLAGTQDFFVCKINPGGTTVIYSTYLGGALAEGWINGKMGIAVDNTGSAIITGPTPSVNYPTQAAAQGVYGGGTWDCVVTKLNPAGNALIFSTYLGGASEDLGYGIAVDAPGNIYVTGYTLSANFPTTVGAFQTVAGGGNDAFVTKYTPAGVVVYSTLLGGSGINEWGRAIAVQGTNAYVVGVTDSPNFPTSPGALQTTNGGGWDLFVTQLNAAGSALVYSTYLGGTLTEDGWGVSVDAAGNAFIGLRTDSANFPATPGAAQTTFGGGSSDGAVVKLNPTGTALIYSTFIGGSGADEVRALTIDGSGRAYITGYTLSPNFPAVNNLQPAFGGGGGDAFVAVVNAAGSAFTFSTWLGGSGPEGGVGIGLDSSGWIYVAGSTNSTDFATRTPIQAANAGGADVFITKLNTAAPFASGTLYGITLNSNQLITINTTTAAGSLVGPLSSNMNSFGIGFRAGKLYAHDDVARLLRELDPLTGATINTINLGAIPGPGGEGDIVFRSDGIGFLHGEPGVGQLWRFDITVPSATLVGTSNPGMDGIAFNSAGVLYGINNAGTRLYTIDTTTGATTLVGNTGITGFPIFTSGGLAFDAAGNLFAALSAFPPGPSTLYSINPTTGVGTAIGNIGFPGVSGLRFVDLGGPPPPPPFNPIIGNGEGTYGGSRGPVRPANQMPGPEGIFGFGGRMMPTPILEGPMSVGNDRWVCNVAYRTIHDDDSGIGIAVSGVLAGALGAALIGIARYVGRFA